MMYEIILFFHSLKICTMKAILTLILIVFTCFACMPKGYPQDEEQAAKLIQIDTNYRLNDPVSKTLTYEFVRHKGDIRQVQDVPMYDTRTVGSIKIINRPLTSLGKSVIE
jgi:hypothetical protein